jgi:tRNA-uridine 2-sulfurtransferase
MKIVVAMSGGVDSSVAAALLAEQGHEVIGVSMQLYDNAGGPDGDRAFGSCCSLDDLHDARRVAAVIGIPHYILNLERQFSEQVVSNFVGEYAAGRTPLPCTHCNSDLKFTALLDRATGFGADAVATGHYARIERSPSGTYQLKRGRDQSKDQSYFLFALSQAQLARAVFPVGDRPKDAVREYAHARRLPVASKPDSQEICFIPDHDYAAFVTRHSPAVQGGEIVDEGGRARTARRRPSLHCRPAKGPWPLVVADWRTDVRARAQAGRAAGGRRTEGVAGAHAADRVRGELD